MSFIQQHLCERLSDLTLLWSSPSARQLNQLANDMNCPVQFAVGLVSDSASHYERTVAERRLVPTRIDHWHDLLNAGMWLLWPQTKLALNQGHIQELDRTSLSTSSGNRSRRRDALTLLDESTVVIVSSQKAPEKLNREHRWRELFWSRRHDWFSSIHPLVLGHGLAEQCLSPYVGLTGKAIHLRVEPELLNDDAAAQAAMIDARVANLVEQGLADPSVLCPLPILGVPGWWPANQRSSFYSDADYFRPLRPR